MLSWGYWYISRQIQLLCLPTFQSSHAFVRNFLCWFYWILWLTRWHAKRLQQAVCQGIRPFHRSRTVFSRPFSTNYTHSVTLRCLTTREFLWMKLKTIVTIEDHTGKSFWREIGWETSLASPLVLQYPSILAIESNESLAKRKLLEYPELLLQNADSCSLD